MRIRKLFKAEMAHTTVGAYTKRCHHIHGHSYKFELFLKSTQPNAAQMVSDFRAVKDIGMNDFFDSFDHAVLIWEKDVRVPIISQINPERHIVVPFNPTAEMMAKAFFYVASAILKVGPKLSGEQDVSVDEIMIHETDTGYASFSAVDAQTDQFPSIEFPKWKFSNGIQAEWKDSTWFDQIKKTLS
ncbi:MAG: 6-pyruvoyl trahydropterin synthase family protein [Elusimicrobiota bacterium]